MLYKIILPLLGCGFLFLTGFTFSRTMLFIKTGIKVTATVVSVRPSANGEFFPVFAYTVNGRDYENTIDVPAAHWGGSEGTRHTVICNRNNPDKMKMTSFGGLFFLPMVLSCFAAVLLLISAWYYWYAANF